MNRVEPETAVETGRHLIVIGPTPPPLHGVAFTTVHLLDAVRAAGLLAAHLDTRDPRPVMTTGRLDLTNVRLALRHAGALVRLLRRHPDAAVYLPLSQGRWGFARDALLIRLARLARRPVIVHLNGGLFDRFYAESTPPERWLIRRTMAAVTQAWILTPAHTDIFAGLVDPARVMFLENTAEDVGSLEASGAHGRDAEGPLRVLYFSNLVPEKGCFDLADALAMVEDTEREIHVRFVGEVEPEVAEQMGSRSEALTANGVRTEVLGPMTGPEKAAQFDWADLFAYPSRYPPEGQPLVLLEALSAGLPIVSTDHSGIPYTVRHEREGLIVPPGDAAATARAIERLRDDPELRVRLGDAARRRYEEAYRPDRFDLAVRRLLTGL